MRPCEGHGISDGGVTTEAAEALSWSKFSAVLPKMRARLHLQRGIYGAVAQATYMANIYGFLSEIGGFCPGVGTLRYH